MTTLKDQNTERQYYVDWLRILLIISVFLFHNGMIFNTWEWHIKNDQQYGGMLKQIMTFALLANALLFMVSGAGTYFALGKRTTGQYLSERFKRLIIPLAVGIFTLVPVQVYIEKASQYDSLLDYYPQMFNGIYPAGNFSWHHLWFIAYLFFVSLIISPFLNFLRSRRFEKFTHWIEKLVIKPFALNIFILPLVLSQILLRPYFESETNALVNDWASLTYYVIFFMAGFILLPVRNITEAMRKYRLWYLAEVIAVTIVLFKVSYMVESEIFSDNIREGSSICLAWSCAITAIGFAKQYFNRDSELRRLANEAIYPFYLLHQPVIVVTGYFITQWEIAVILKAVVIMISTFTITVTLYWFFIRPFNPLRIIFGMKKLRKEKEEDEITLVLNPVRVEADRSLSEMNQKTSGRKLALNQ
jgi:peptidoglycan/LPS O-acetylase OafA/YrhL